jgi:hypothetical protein
MTLPVFVSSAAKRLVVPYASRVIAFENGPNASSQISKHYVLLVSLDGFRYDYANGSVPPITS